MNHKLFNEEQYIGIFKLVEHTLEHYSNPHIFPDGKNILALETLNIIKKILKSNSGIEEFEDKLKQNPNFYVDTYINNKKIED